jgi:methylenetetrahydrofolate--tRNA-(uracil-5-)-methyltransferase
MPLAIRHLLIIGGGLAGSEAAYQAAQRGIKVRLYEMRPRKTTGAHVSDKLAELVCSNSLGSNLVDRASGLLKAELRIMESLIVCCADESAVPAGGALAVDREKFAESVTARIESHPNIEIVREEVARIPDEPCIIASGPLTSESLANDIARALGSEHLYFYDALAPIVYADSIDMSIAFKASRYGKGEDDAGDYINCPFTKDEYENFVRELLSAERIQLREFEEAIQSGVNAGAGKFFEGCLPAEIIASRGTQSLAFGPMRPVGLTDPRTGRWPHAVVQLRQDNLAASLYNIVGFQTNLTWTEQKRVFRLIPGLGNAEFARYGQMHRNTFINSPTLLEPTMQSRNRPDLFFAGQITGVE